MKSFLFKHLYRHPQVMQTTANAQIVVRELFEAYTNSPQEMSSDFSLRRETPRAVADYIAGMTDRFATREHQRLTGRQLFA
jgi:dGTPase